MRKRNEWRKVNGPKIVQKVQQPGAAHSLGRATAGSSHAKQNSTASKKVPRVPPATWAYRVRPSPKPSHSQMSLGQGLPALPAQELQGRRSGGPTRALVALASAEGGSGARNGEACLRTPTAFQTPNSAAREGRRGKRQGRQGCGRLRAAASGGRPKSRPKRGSEIPVGNTRKTNVTPDGKSGEVTLPATPPPLGRGGCARTRRRTAAGSRRAGDSGSAARGEAWDSRETAALSRRRRAGSAGSGTAALALINVCYASFGSQSRDSSETHPPDPVLLRCLHRLD